MLDPFLVVLLWVVAFACLVSLMQDDVNDVCRDCPVCKKRREDRDA